MILYSQNEQYDPNRVINSRDTTATPRNFNIISLFCKAVMADILNLYNLITGSSSLTFIPVSGATYAPAASVFTPGGNVAVLSNSSGTVAITLPDATQCGGGKMAFSSTAGSNVTVVASVSGQTLDGQNINAALTVNRPTYTRTTGLLTPAQGFTIASDGTNWHFVSNY